MPVPEGPAAMFVHVSDDPERDWGRIAPHALHEVNAYGAWAKGNPDYPYQPVEDAATLRDLGTYLVLTPDECIAYARAHGGVSFKPVMGGLDPDIGWESLRLVESAVLPALAAGSTAAG
jgi:hypothetical protein